MSKVVAAESPQRDLESAIKSNASTASLGFAEEGLDDGSACGHWGTRCSPANPRQAALASDLVTVPGRCANSRLDHVPPRVQESS